MPGRWHEPIDTRRLPLAGMLAAVVALGLNVGLSEVGRRWLDVPKDEQLLSLVSIRVTTVAAVAVAAFGLGALAHTQARPFSAFRSLAAIVLLISCIGPLAARAGWIPDIATISTPAMTIMLVMHVATTAVIVAFFTTLPRAGEPRRRFGA
jgi:hypothetical protein